MSRFGAFARPGPVLFGIYLAAVLGSWSAPHAPEAQHRLHAYRAPTPIRFADQDGHWRMRPHACVGAPDAVCARRVPLQFLVTDERLGRDGAAVRMFGVSAPDHVFLLGTDRFGRDQLSRLLHGARTSLLVGVLAAGLAVALGLAAGVVAGVRKGVFDVLAMRGGEVLMALPWLYLLITLRGLLPASPSAWGAVVSTAVVLAGLGWVTPARLVRSVALRVAVSPCVEAARGFGAGDAYVMVRHVLPEVAPLAVTQLAILAPRFVLAEVTLSYLGFGVPEPMPSWGGLLLPLSEPRALVTHGWMAWPAVALVLVVVSYHRWSDVLAKRLGIATV